MLLWKPVFGQQGLKFISRIATYMTERPLSPHLQVYRLPPTAIFSISHRVTGVLLVAGMFLLTLILMGLASGREAFLSVQAGMQTALGRALLWAWLFSLFFHLCHGVRHLLWDIGQGFERERLNRHAGYELAAALLLTGLVAWWA